MPHEHLLQTHGSLLFRLIHVGQGRQVGVHDGRRARARHLRTYDPKMQAPDRCSPPRSPSRRRRQRRAAILAFIRELAAYERLSHQVAATEADLHRWLFGPERVVEALVARRRRARRVRALLPELLDIPRDDRGSTSRTCTSARPRAGRGVGRALLTRLAQLAVARGWGRVEWSVLDWNEPAIRFYRSLGATVLDDWRICRLTGDAHSPSWASGPTSNRCAGGETFRLRRAARGGAGALPELRAVGHHLARAARRARRPQAGAAPHPLHDVAAEPHGRRQAPQVREGRRRRDGQLPPARRRRALRDARAHGAAVLAALPARRRLGQLRLARRRRAAAMRYTECRLARISDEMLEEIDRTRCTSARTTTARRPSRSCCRRACRTCSSTARPASPSAWRRTSRRTTSARCARRSSSCSTTRPDDARSCAATSRAPTSRPAARSSTPPTS
jgi:ribosomal protein S18 acetylase RimI-like enzyme